MQLQQPFAIHSILFTNPLSIPGCKLWLDASQLGLTDGTAVSSWTDLSGSSHSFAQGTGANQPIFHTNIINSLPAVLFDGSDDFMSLTGTITAQPLTVFLVVKPTLNTASQKTYAVMIHSDVSFIVAKLSTNFWGTFGSSDISSTSALTSGTSYLLENTASSGSVILYQRGVLKVSVGDTEIGSGSNSGLGKDLVNANRQYAGYIAEVIVYNTVLSSGNRVKVENYLIAKYAL